MAVILTLAAGFFAGREEKKLPKNQQWHGVHLLSYNSDEDLETLSSQIPKLAEMGVNVLILEVDYHFRFRSYPRMRQGRQQITPEGASKFAAVCRKQGVRLIPQFQCLGHQSWKGTTFPLLTVYPELDLTPGTFPGNKGIYCREWDPVNPKVNEIVFKLMDEILDGFGADALHVGLDEVFLLGSDQSPSTRNEDPAKLFAKVVNDLHSHLVKTRKVEMLMWGDRLFDAKKYNWNKWEAAKNGTAGAVDMIPKDIILCPWHYERREAYPSLDLFLSKEFRVLPASFHKLDASRALIEYSLKLQSPKILGHLFTTWGKAKKDTLPEYPPMVQGLKLLKESSKTDPRR